MNIHKAYSAPRKLSFWQRFQKWRRARHFAQFRQFLQTYEDSERWGKGVHCLNCRSVNAVHAFFCSQCGESLQEIQQWIPEREPQTESLPAQLPFPSIRQKAMARTETQEMPSVRLKRGF